MVLRGKKNSFHIFHARNIIVDGTIIIIIKNLFQLVRNKKIRRIRGSGKKKKQFEL